VKALGVGQRGSQSVIIPMGRPPRLRRVRHVHRYLPGWRSYQRHVSLQDAPLGDEVCLTVCTHCSNGCKTTLSVRNNEFCAPTTAPLRLQSGFPVRQGPLRFRFYQASGAPEAAAGARDGKLVPSSWEDAIAEVSRRLAEIRKASGATRSDSSFEPHTNEENYMLGRIARASIGTNNIGHHRPPITRA